MWPPCLCCVSDITCIGLGGCLGKCFGGNKKKQPKELVKIEDTTFEMLNYYLSNMAMISSNHKFTSWIFTN